MAFIRNNPTTQHRRATGHFENGKVNRAQQENKARQRMMRAGSRVYTRNNAVPMTTGQAVATTLALGTIGLLAGSALQSAQAAPSMPVQANSASPLQSCISDIPLPAKHGTSNHHLENRCGTRETIYVRSGCSHVAGTVESHRLEIGQTADIITKNGHALAGCEAPFKQSLEPVEPKQVTRCLKDYAFDWGSRATEHQLVNDCRHETTVYLKPECRTNDYQSTEYHFPFANEHKKILTKNGAALKACENPLVENPVNSDNSVPPLKNCIFDIPQPINHDTVNHHLLNNCGVSERIHVRLGCSALAEHPESPEFYTLEKGQAKDVITKSGAALAGCEAPFRRDSAPSKLSKATDCLDDSTFDWGSHATLHRLVNDCNHETDVYLKPECRTKDNQPINYDFVRTNQREEIITKNGAILTTCENPFIKNPTQLSTAVLNKCVVSYPTTFGSGVDEHSLINENCFENSKITVRDECLPDDYPHSVHNLAFNEVKLVYTKSEAAETGCGQPFEDETKPVDNTLTVDTQISTSASQIPTENIGECLEAHLKKDLLAAGIGNDIFDVPRAKDRATVTHNLYNRNENRQAVHIIPGCNLEGTPLSHKINGRDTLEIITKSEEALEGCGAPFRLTNDLEETDIQVSRCLIDSPSPWGSKAIKHNLVNACKLNTTVSVKPDCLMSNNQPTKYDFATKERKTIITKNAAALDACDIPFVTNPVLLPPKPINTCINDYPTFFGSNIDKHTLANDNCWQSSQVWVKEECLTDEYQSPFHGLNTKETATVYTKSEAAQLGCSDPFVMNISPDKEPSIKKRNKVESDKYSTITYTNNCKNPVKLSWNSVNPPTPHESLLAPDSRGIVTSALHIDSSSLKANGTIFEPLVIIDPAEVVKPPSPYSKGAFIRTNTFTPESSLLFLKKYTNMLKTMPDPMKVASETVKKALIRAKIHNIDPDKVYYHRFTSAISCNGCYSGWKHYRAPAHSYSLTQAAMLQAYNEFYDDPEEMSSAVGIYHFGYQKDRQWWDGNGEAPLLGKDFMNAMQSIDIQGDYTKALNSFWAQNTQSYTSMLKDCFQISATNQRQTGQMTESEYLLAMSVLTNRNSVSCYKLDVYGYKSKDILLIENRRGKGGLLYMPGSSPAFTSYASRDELKNKIITQAKNPHYREILERHFTLYDRQDGTTYSGVDSALKGLAAAKWDKQYLMQKLSLMPYDIFAQVTEDTKAAMVSDGDTSVKSNAEARRDYFLDISGALMNYLPVFDVILPEVMVPAGIGLLSGQFGSSLDKAINGDSLDERMEGTYASTVTGALLGASLIIPAMVKAVSALDSSLEQAESTLLTAKTEAAPEIKVTTEINQSVSPELMSGFTNRVTQVIHPKTTQLLLGVELADSKEKVLLRPLGNNQHVRVDPATGEYIGNNFFYKAMNPNTGETQWLEGGGLKGGVDSIDDDERILTTWDATEDEIASMRASSSTSEREIITPDDVRSSGSGYPDMSGAETPEELAKLDLKSKIDSLTKIRSPEVLKEMAKDAAAEAELHPWRSRYSSDYLNKVVYRGDGRLPDELFYSGFIRHDVPPKIIEIGDTFGVIGAVSTTMDQKIALKYAINQVPGGYVYALKLRNGGIHLNSASLQGESLKELAVLNVPPQDIMFAVGPFDTVKSTLVKIEGLDSIEIRLNPYSDATYEQAKEAYDALRSKLSTALTRDETICFYDRWQSRKDLLFHESDANVYLDAQLEAFKKSQASAS